MRHRVAEQEESKKSCRFLLTCSKSNNIICVTMIHKGEVEMEKTYRCIKGFSVSKYDEHECLIENEEMFVPVDSIWELCDFSSLSDIRLDGESGWLEIDEETLKAYFVEI